jgi:hypothetical protein
LNDCRDQTIQLSEIHVCTKTKSPPLPAGWCGSKTVMTLDLHANSCRAVRGTVMVAVVDVVDQRH